MNACRVSLISAIAVSLAVRIATAQIDDKKSVLTQRNDNQRRGAYLYETLLTPSTVNPSSFGFAVAVHPRDPDTAWFVPAIKDELRVPVEGALVVTRTRNGGKSFESLRSGLPQRHAYHLIYRHGLEVAPDGQTLAMGSTTGTLWVSRDAGESWTALSRDLPPVYCVRFGGTV